MLKKIIISSFLILFIYVYLYAEEYELNKTILNIPNEEAVVVNKEWICGLGDFPNEITERLSNLFQYTLENLDIDPYGDPVFKSSKYPYEEKGKGYTYVYRDKSNLIEAKKIYRNNNLIFNDINSIYYFAKKMISLKNDYEKLKFCFNCPPFYINFEIPKNRKNKSLENVFWNVSDQITLYPGKFSFTIDDKRVYVFNGCYKIKDLIELANYQIKMAKQFISKFDKEVQVLKQINKLKFNSN